MAKTSSSLQKDDNAQKATKRMEVSREYTQPYFDRFLDNYKHYFIRVIDEAVEADPDAYPFYSQLMIPISYQTVETILPRMFNRLPNFSISTEEDNDEADEQAFQNLIKYQMNHPYLVDDPIFLRMVTALKETFIAGNAWGMVPWYMKDVQTFEWQPFHAGMGLNEPSWNNMEKIQYYNQQPQWAKVKVTKRVIDAPVFEHKSLFHVFPDAKKKRVSELGYLIFEDNMTMDQIMDMVNISPKEYKHISQMKQLQPISTTMTKGTNYDQELANIFGSTDFSTRDDGQKQYKVWFMNEPDKLSIIVNETLTIRESDNPNGDGKIGAFLMKDIPVPQELYAWGEPDPIKKMEDAISDQANMRFDSIFYDLLKMFKIDPTAIVDGEEFIPEPGTIVQVKDMNAIQPIDMGQTKQSAYNEYKEWDQIIQNVSGVSDYATGQATPEMTKTLGGIELLQQAANARFALKLQLFEQLGLKAMGTMYVQRNLQFFDTAQMVQTDNGKQQVTPEQIRRIKGNIHFIVDSGSTEATNQTTEQTKWQTIISMLGKPPFDNISREGLDEMALKMLYALRVTNPESIIQAGQQQGQSMGGFTQEQLQTLMTIMKKMQAESTQQASQVAAAKAKESVSIAYKDAPPDIQRQMEAAAGFEPSKTGVIAPPSVNGQQPITATTQGTNDAATGAVLPPPQAILPTNNT